ncbi:MAG: hypothetical protein LBP34_03155 [Flavobacteriaceae bacterium]|jgi:hypothetical protein|nr:hypothetical protein [Flavobacteriaceae bacterium]
MRKNLILILSCIPGILLHSQNLEESTYTEKDRILESLSFSIPICTKDVLVSTWKNFIKKQGGKVIGGIINKASGADIKFTPSGDFWSGHFAYGFNDDETITIFTSFQNDQGDFMSFQSPEKEVAFPVLEEFRMDILKSCTLDDLNRSRSYSITLSKEKIRNSDRIMYLEKNSRNNQLKIDLKSGQELSEKEQLNLEKIKQRIISNESELQALKNRNIAIEEELKAQDLVIQRFEQRMDTLEGKIIPNEVPESGSKDEETAGVENNTLKNNDTLKNIETGNTKETENIEDIEAKGIKKEEEEDEEVESAE